MYNLQHVFPIEEYPEFKSRGVMSITANCLETFVSYSLSLDIQTWVILCRQFVSPYLNLILLLISKSSKFPYTSYSLKIYFAL
jgi:hypothetical protein